MKAHVSSAGGTRLDTLDTLVTSIRDVVHQHHDEAQTASAVASGLRRAFSAGLALPERYLRSDPDHYVQHVIHAEPDGSFSIVALVWLPGQHTPIHDHVAWCVTGVYQGQETEQRYTLHGDGDSYLALAHLLVNPARSVGWLLPPGDIHQVRNSGQNRAISLHVYGANIASLRTSVRRVYELPVRAAA
jgi:predicted metal-dependent enzyme (double-stranded beta helix superfamily)